MNLAVYFEMSQLCMNSGILLVVPLVTISILLPYVGDLSRSHVPRKGGDFED